MKESSIQRITPRCGRRALVMGAALMLGILTTTAKVTLPKIFGDGMVLQRETQVNIWGEARHDAIVKITTSWDKKRHITKSARDGKWKCAIPTPEAGGPYTITLDDGEKTIIRDILIGEVWVCSGQSNMEMTMKGFKGQPVEGAIEDGLRSLDRGWLAKPRPFAQDVHGEAQQPVLACRYCIWQLAGSLTSQLA